MTVPPTDEGTLKPIDEEIPERIDGNAEPLKVANGTHQGDLGAITADMVYLKNR